MKHHLRLMVTTSTVVTFPFCIHFWLLMMFFGLIVFAQPAQSQSDANSSQWPRFLGANYDGVAGPEVASVNWLAEPKTAWSLEVGEGYGIGSVAKERYYHFDAVTKPQGDPLEHPTVERLRAIDLNTGKQLWVSEQPLVYQDMLGYENGPRASPTVVGDRVFTLGVTGILTCRDTSQGTEQWRVDTNERYGVVQNFFGVGASPLWLNGKLIVMVGGSPAEDQKVGPMQLDRVSPNGSAIVAFDPKDGKELWRCGDDLASYSSPRPITVGDKTLVLAFLRSGLMAIDPESGSVRWKYDHRARILESVNAMTPVVKGNQVLISECYEVGSVLLEVDADECRELWKDPPRDRRAQAFRAHWATPVLLGDYLFGCSGRNAPDSDFRCVEFATGKVLWKDDRQTRSSVTRVGDYLLLLEERGLMQLIQPHHTELKVVAEWDLSQPAENRPGLSYPCWSAPAVVGNRALVRGTDHVVCLQFPNR